MKTNEVPLGVARSAELRSSAIVDKIRAALAVIDAELKSNNGVYPKNGGRLPLAEVCRRSGVHPQTLQNAAQAATKKYVQEWINNRWGLEGRLAVGRGSGVGRRADELQLELSRVAAQYQLLYQVEIPHRDEELDRLRGRVDELELENRALSIAASEGKVVVYPRSSQK